MLYETGGWASQIRASPDGERIAFIDHPVPADDSGDARAYASSYTRELSALHLVHGLR